MAKKITRAFVVLSLIAVMCIALVACNNASDNTTIVFLGDSIAEALIGPSPLGERDNYGYYALIGKSNNFNYYNHSVSGHKTSSGMAGSDGLLQMVQRENENAALMRTHIKQADIIHISILGNNVLQYNLGLLMLEVADPAFGEKYERGETLLNALHDGRTMYRDPVDEENFKYDENGDLLPVEFDFPPTYQDICDIVATLKELNPDATIIFQTVYNPLYEDSTLLHKDVKQKLADITDDGRFGAAGTKITTVAQYRKVAQAILDKLNGILTEYLEKHRVEGEKDDFIILDVNAEFNRITAMDKDEKGEVDLSADSLGRQLTYEDCTHPSNFGHAIIAGCTQRLLDELGMSNAHAVNRYKAIKRDQLNRLFKEVDGFDYNAAVKAVNDATTFEDVTMAYFAAIDGYTPLY